MFVSKRAITQTQTIIIAVIAIIAAVAITYYATRPAPTPTPLIVDTDGDGVPDSDDQWPGRDDKTFGEILYVAPEGVSYSGLWTFDAFSGHGAACLMIEVYEGLVTVGKNLDEFVPALAESWEVSEDGKVYTFNLRKGVTFTTDSDGDGELDPFNAECVKYTFDWAEKIGTPVEVGGWPYDHCEIIDDYTVKLYLKHPCAWAISILADPHSGCMIVNPKFVEKNGGPENDEFLQTHADGTGPYMVEEFVLEEHTIFVANPNYWRGWEGKHIKKIVMRDIPEVITREMLLARGDLDVSFTPLPYIPELKARIESENLPLQILDKDADGNTLKSMKVMYLWLNSKVPPTNELVVRKGFAHSFDYDNYIEEVLRGLAKAAYMDIPSGCEWAFEATRDIGEHAGYEFNLTKAKEYFDKASPEAKKILYEDGIKLPYLGGTGYVLMKGGALMWKSDLEKIGVKMILEEIDWSAWYDALVDSPIGELSWEIDFPDPNNAIYYQCHMLPLGYGSSWIEDGGWNAAGAGNDEIDALADEAAREVDRAKRIELYCKLETAAAEQCWWLFLYEPSTLQVTRTPGNIAATYVHGWELLGTTYMHSTYYTLYKEPVS